MGVLRNSREKTFVLRFLEKHASLAGYQKNSLILKVIQYAIHDACAKIF